ncbi:MAG: DUF503 domain-containing protein [Dehalococcoidia bacterium]|nr:DUF503 domain-containing protein [Dehalococcoidia bacterium]
MNIGICRIALRLPENDNLKAKRMLVRSVTDRVRNKSNVSISEVADNDNWELLTIGIAYVSNESRHGNEVMSKVVEYIDTIKDDGEMLDYDIELITV